MALARLEEVSRSLVLAGLPADTPAAAIHWGTTGAQRTLVSTLVELPERCRDSQLRPPALIVIGKVVSERSERPWFESRPLFGRRVLHTRDGEAGDRLTRLIGELGGEAVPLPVTEHLACATRDIDEAVASLRGQAFDWVVFASARAVEAFVDAVWRGGGDARSFHGTRLAAIGQRTARALEVRGLRADRIPGHGDGAALGQALADQGAGARALVPRASGGRPELVESLSRAFDEVVTVDVYETRDVDPGAAHMIDGLERIRRGDIDAALLFAPSQVRALTRALGDDAAAVLSAIPVIATIGATTAEELSSLGVRARIIASRPDASTLLAELAAHFDSDEEA